MKALDTMRKMAGRGVIIEWNEHPRGSRIKSRQAKLSEFRLSSGILRKGEAKFV